jgi:hypothetical protein
MSRKSVTLNFNETDYDDLLVAAQEAGYETVGVFAKDLVLNRGELPEARLDPQSEQKVLRMQGAMELLQNQLNAALEAKANGAAGGLAGAPPEIITQKQVSKQVEEMLRVELEKRDAKETKEKYEALLECVDSHRIQSRAASK